MIGRPGVGWVTSVYSGTTFPFLLSPEIAEVCSFEWRNGC
jgi:hypothetical protein